MQAWNQSFAEIDVVTSLSYTTGSLHLGTENSIDVACSIIPNQYFPRDMAPTISRVYRDSGSACAA